MGIALHTWTRVATATVKRATTWALLFVWATVDRALLLSDALARAALVGIIVTLVRIAERLAFERAGAALAL